MIKVVLHKIIYWSIILIPILRANSLFAQVPVISIPQPAEIGRFDNFHQTSPQKTPGISSSRDALIQRQNEAIIREVKKTNVEEQPSTANMLFRNTWNQLNPFTGFFLNSRFRMFSKCPWRDTWNACRQKEDESEKSRIRDGKRFFRE